MNTFRIIGIILLVIMYLPLYFNYDLITKIIGSSYSALTYFFVTVFSIFAILPKHALQNQISTNIVGGIFKLF
jgi:uncharacterized membrane protein YuzA (DUF378 family)